MSSRNTATNKPGKKPTKSRMQQQQAAKRAMAAASGAKAARNKRLVQVLAPVCAVIVVAAILVIINVVGSGSKSANTASAAGTAVTKAVTSVPASVFDAVGAGSGAGPTATLTGSALTENGKPKVLYVGADWCPYCAAERWALAAAVSRFGSLTDLGQTASSPTDVDANTPTLTFHGSHYSSDVISASLNDIQDGAGKPLDRLSKSENALWLKLTGNKGSFPFIDIGGKYQFGVQYDPAILAGKTHAEIAGAMSDPTSKIGIAIDGSANILTAAICDVTNGQPAKVCTSKGVVAGKSKLGGQSNLTKDKSQNKTNG